MCLPLSLLTPDPLLRAAFHNLCSCSCSCSPSRAVCVPYRFPVPQTDFLRERRTLGNRRLGPVSSMPPRYGTPAIRPQPLETRLQDVLAGVDSPAKDAARAVVTIMQSSAGPQAHCNQTLQDVLGELRMLFGGALELPDISQGEEVATGEIELPHGTVWRATATGWEHIQPKYRVLRKIAEWQQQIEDMASQPGSPLMALVTVQKRIPHFCPFALLHITIFICGDMALSPTDRNLTAQGRLEQPRSRSFRA